MLRQARFLTRVPKRFNSNSTAVEVKEDTVVKPKNRSEITDVLQPNMTQAPNRKDTWAPSQNPRSEAIKGPRFEQLDIDMQPRPYASIELIAKHPVRYLHEHSAVCDGGGPQGHPKIFINLDKPGAHACLYCGTRFAHESSRAEVEAGVVAPSKF